VDRYGRQRLVRKDQNRGKAEAAFCGLYWTRLNRLGVSSIYEAKDISKGRQTTNEGAQRHQSQTLSSSISRLRQRSTIVLLLMLKANSYSGLHPRSAAALVRVRNWGHAGTALLACVKSVPRLTASTCKSWKWAIPLPSFLNRLQHSSLGSRFPLLTGQDMATSDTAAWNLWLLKRYSISQSRSRPVYLDERCCRRRSRTLMIACKMYPALRPARCSFFRFNRLFSHSPGRNSITRC